MSVYTCKKCKKKSTALYHCPSCLAKDIEEGRKFWAEIAKKHDWYVEPFFLQVWVKNGEVEDCVSFRGIKKDIIIFLDAGEE